MAITKMRYVVYDLTNRRYVRTDTSTDDVAFNSISVGGESGPNLSDNLGNLDVNSVRILNLLPPVEDHDAATKEYVDNVAQGLGTKNAVWVGTTASDMAGVSIVSGTGNVLYTNIPNKLATTATSTNVVVTSVSHGLSNGNIVELVGVTPFNGLLQADVSGPKTITATTLNTFTYVSGTAATTTGSGGSVDAQYIHRDLLVLSGLPAGTLAPKFDGIEVAVNDRILVKNFVGANATYNGIFYVYSVASTTSVRLSRTADADNQPLGQSSEIRGGTFVFVDNGVTQADTGWVVSAPQGLINLGSNQILWAQFSAAGIILAGNGLIKDANTISVLVADNSLYADYNGVKVNTGDGLVVTAGSLGKLAVLAADNTINVSSAGIKIATATSGTFGQLLETNGSGGVEWVTPTASAISDFNEAAQDAVGNILTNTNTITFTYTDASNQITANVALAANSGLNTTSGVAVDASIAGAGLTLTAGVLDIGQGAAITVNSNSIAVNLAANSGLNTSSGLAVDASIAGNGLTFGSGVLAVGQGNGITVGSDAISVDISGGSAGQFMKTTGSGIVWADALTSVAGLAGAGLVVNGSALDISADRGLTVVSDSVGIDITTGSSGQYLQTTGSGVVWSTVDALPAQSGHGSQFLTTNGTSPSWATVDALPPQPTHGGQFLTTNGTAASWATVPLNITLQDAYNNDPDGGNAIITTNSVDGLVQFSGTEGVLIDAAMGLTMLTDITMSNNSNIKTESDVGITSSLTMITGTSTSADSGSLYITSGNGATSTGQVAFITGDVTATSGTVGPINFATGSSSKDDVVGGDIVFSTGDLTGNNCFGGNIIMYAGATNAFRGQLQVNAGDAHSEAISLRNLDNLMIDMLGRHAEVTISLPDVVADYNLMLPVDAGSALQFLTTDGAGNLSWSDVGQGAGITVNSNVVSINLAANSGLNTTSGLAVDASIAGAGLTLTTGVLDVGQGAGITVNSSTVAINLAAISGLNTTSGLAVGQGAGITVNSNTVAINLGSNSGLNTSSGLVVDASIAGAGLTLTAGVLDVSAGDGITVGSSAISINLADQSLRTTGSGLSVRYDQTFSTDTDAVAVGNIVYEDTAGHVAVANADLANIADGTLFGISTVKTNSTTSEIVIKAGALVSGLTLTEGGTFTINSPVYLSKTAGQVTQATGSWTTGSLVELGYAKSTTDILFNPRYMVFLG